MTTFPSTSFLKLFFIFLIYSVIAPVLGGCKPEQVPRQQPVEQKPDSLKVQQRTLLVKATAYNSTRAQTDTINPWLTAFGDTLNPQMKAIAVSRDLLRMGLTHNTPVQIEGLEGTYYVKDKMHSRHRKKIDIYMGKDIARARQWGIQQVLISWTDTIPVTPPQNP